MFVCNVPMCSGLILRHVLQLDERQQSGSRAAGHNQAEEPPHHHRLLQQGPVGQAAAATCGTDVKAKQLSFLYTPFSLL